MPWRGPVIGDGIEDWTSITENIDYRINLTGLLEVIQAEFAWMAHWQAADGTRSSVLAISQLANILRRAITEGHPSPASIRQMDWDDAAALQSWFYASRWGRFPPHGPRARLRVIFRFARTALIGACHDGRWRELDYWHPRCDSRIPLSEREPQAHYGKLGLGGTVPYLFPKLAGNRKGTRTWTTSYYDQTLRQFSIMLELHDCDGQPLSYSRSHRLRHTKAATLLNAGAPVHVVQRYLVHRSPEMTMRYAATLASTAEREFLAMVKIGRDGRQAGMDRRDMLDILQLDRRTDRILPNGLLPAAPGPVL